MKPRLDVATISIGLAAAGFGVVLLLSPLLPQPLIQPILALTLAAAGTIGLLLTTAHKNRRKQRKELP